MWGVKLTQYPGFLLTNAYFGKNQYKNRTTSAIAIYEQILRIFSILVSKPR